VRRLQGSNPSPGNPGVVNSKPELISKRQIVIYDLTYKVRREEVSLDALLFRVLEQVWEFNKTLPEGNIRVAPPDRAEADPESLDHVLVRVRVSHEIS